MWNVCSQSPVYSQYPYWKVLPRLKQWRWKLNLAFSWWRTDPTNAPTGHSPWTLFPFSVTLQLRTPKGGVHFTYRLRSASFSQGNGTETALRQCAVWDHEALGPLFQVLGIQPSTMGTRPRRPADKESCAAKLTSPRWGCSHWWAPRWPSGLS